MKSNHNKQTDSATENFFIEMFTKRLLATTGRHSNITGQQDFVDGVVLARPINLFWDTYQGKGSDKIISEKYPCMVGKKGKEKIVDFQLYFWSGIPTIKLSDDNKLLSDDAIDVDISFLPSESYYKALHSIMKQWLLNGEKCLGDDRKDRVFLALFEELVKINNGHKEFDENPLSVIEEICWSKEYKFRGTK